MKLFRTPASTSRTTSGLFARRFSNLALVGFLLAPTLTGCVGDGDFDTAGTGPVVGEEGAPFVDPGVQGPPVVTDRYLDGDSFVFLFDRPVSETELDLARTELEAFARNDKGVLERQNFAGQAALEDEGFALRVQLHHEDAPAGEIYFARVALAGAEGETLDLGIARGSQESVAPKMEGQQPQGFDWTPRIPFPIPLPMPPATRIEATGTVPRDGAVLNRNTRMIRINFNKDLKCSDMVSKDLGIRMTVSPNSGRGFGQTMFLNTRGRRPRDAWYQGHFECLSSRQLAFHLPINDSINLLGAATVRLEVVGRDTEGWNGPRRVFYYTTKNPGLSVKVQKVVSRLSKKCDPEPVLKRRKYKKRCDVYIATHTYAGGNPSSPSTFGGTAKIPSDRGDWGNMTNGEVQVVNQPLLYKESPVPSEVAFSFVAIDSDGNSQAATAFKIWSRIDALAGAIVSIWFPPAAAIGTAGAALHDSISRAISNNEDDLIGSLRFNLRKSQGWSTFGPAIKKTIKSGKGDIDLYLDIQEAPRSWVTPVEII